MDPEDIKALLSNLKSYGENIKFRIKKKMKFHKHVCKTVRKRPAWRQQ